MRTTSLRKTGLLATESIQFQSGVFFKELSLLIGEVRKLKSVDIQDSDQLQSIERCIKHHTNLNTEILADTDIGPAVDIPHVTKNHPLVLSFIRNFVSTHDVDDHLKKAGGIIKGSVSLKDGYVDGVFSEIKTTIYLPAKLISGSTFSEDELAAVLLHEIGHLITYYEYLVRTITLNYVLDGISKSIDNSDSVDKRTSILISASKALKLDQKDLDKLATTNSKETVACVFLSKAIEESRSILGNNIYDLNSWEFLADDYATRHQAGKNLVTAFDKIYRAGGDIAFRGTGKYIAFEAAKLALIVIGLMATTFSLGALLFFASFLMVNSDSDNPIYDKPEARMRRVRAQIIENLKDNRLPNETINRLKEDIEVIDNIMKEVDDKRQFFGVIYDFFSSKDRNEILLQQELEQIANNDLFIKAASFKLLA